MHALRMSNHVHTWHGALRGASLRDRFSLIPRVERPPALSLFRPTLFFRVSISWRSNLRRSNDFDFDSKMRASFALIRVILCSPASSCASSCSDQLFSEQLNSHCRPPDTMPTAAFSSVRSRLESDPESTRVVLPQPIKRDFKNRIFFRNTPRNNSFTWSTESREERCKASSEARL